MTRDIKWQEMDQYRKPTVYKLMVAAGFDRKFKHLHQEVKHTFSHTMHSLARECIVCENVCLTS